MLPPVFQGQKRWLAYVARHGRRESSAERWKKSSLLSEDLLVIESRRLQQCLLNATLLCRPWELKIL